MNLDAAEQQASEWFEELPRLEELTPLSQMLISPALTLAFSIKPEPCRSMLDVDRASQDTIAKLRSSAGIKSVTNSSKPLPPFSNEVENGADDGEPYSPTEDEGGRKRREVELGFLPENSSEDPSARMLKRARLVWTPQLHKRFVDVVSHVGIKNAVPKTIMQLMNVEGLTRENVASHLQKYRLYLKRMQGFSGEGPSSSSDILFASLPSRLAGLSFAADQREELSGQVPVLVPFASAPFVAVAQGHAPPAMHSGGAREGAYNMFEAQSHNGYGRNFIPQRMSGGEQHRDWSCNKFKGIVAHQYFLG